jgi:pSer/pThr/pTyr-binding forkhead associated (FHA) protein
VSRHHLQLRLRFGVYVLFDIRSQSGTFVNNNCRSRTPSQRGDVIQIGKSQLVYIEDDP